MGILDYILRPEGEAIPLSLYSEGWIQPAAQPPPPPQRHAPHRSLGLPLLTVGMVHETTGLNFLALELALWLLSTP